MNKLDYPPDWPEIARAIKARAGYRCEWCGIKHGTIRLSAKGRPFREIMTTAHMDHNTANNKPENLRCLCTTCHLRYDVHLHRFNAKQTRFRKKLAAGQTCWINPHSTETVARDLSQGERSEGVMRNTLE